MTHSPTPTNLEEILLRLTSNPMDESTPEAREKVAREAYRRGGGMKIEYNTNALKLAVDDSERANWLDGQKLYYALPKDHRPDINPYDVEDCQQIYYKLYYITKDNFDLNQVPPELIEALNNLSKLTEIVTDYSNHVLGIISQAQENAPKKEGTL